MGKGIQKTDLLSILLTRRRWWRKIIIIILHETVPYVIVSETIKIGFRLSENDQCRYVQLHSRSIVFADDPIVRWVDWLTYRKEPRKRDWISNKAGYTATQVACGWAGAMFEVTRPFGQEQWGPKIKIIKKVKCDRPTDRPTDKAGCRVACTRLKIAELYAAKSFYLKH